MIIRNMKIEDYDAVVEVWRAAGLHHSPAGRESRVSIARQIAEFPTLSLVAEEEGRIAGVALGTHDARKGWLNRLAVPPEFQKRGIAKQLIARIEIEFADMGIQVIAALVMADNQASKALCARLGYECMEDVLYFSKRTREDV